MPKKIEAKIIADSINESGTRITTYVLTYPRFIHAELMTHRVFSRNSASSRAIPFEKMLKMVEEDPFIPIAWQKDHKGMQGTEYYTSTEMPNSLEEDWFDNRWLESRDLAVKQAIIFNKAGITKQLCNRLLEPFMWHTVIVTATEFDNFFELRCPSYMYKGEPFKSRKELIRSYTFEKGYEEDRKYLEALSDLDCIKMSTSGAEIHIQALAEAMWDTMNESTPKKLKGGEWHIPFGDQMNVELMANIAPHEKSGITMAKIAVARCARLSYMTFDGEINYEKDIALYNQLLQSKHLSPFENVALCPLEFTTYGVYKPDNGYTHLDFEGNYWSGNFKHWIQYRQLIDE